MALLISPNNLVFRKAHISVFLIKLRLPENLNHRTVLKVVLPQIKGTLYSRNLDSFRLLAQELDCLAPLLSPLIIFDSIDL
jgi:hypothetical protein